MNASYGNSTAFEPMVPPHVNGKYRLASSGDAISMESVSKPVGIFQNPFRNVVSCLELNGAVPPISGEAETSRVRAAITDELRMHRSQGFAETGPEIQSLLQALNELENGWIDKNKYCGIPGTTSRYNEAFSDWLSAELIWLFAEPLTPIPCLRTD